MRESNARDYPMDRLEALIAYFTSDKLLALAAERDCLVATIDGAIIGTAAREGSALATFFVHPGWQSRGVGTRLLEQLEQNAQALGMESLHVGASSTGAAFYERHGYHRSGVIINGAAGPQIELAKQLSSALTHER